MHAVKNKNRSHMSYGHICRKYFSDMIMMTSGCFGKLPHFYGVFREQNYNISGLV